MNTMPKLNVSEARSPRRAPALQRHIDICALFLGICMGLLAHVGDAGCYFFPLAKVMHPVLQLAKPLAQAIEVASASVRSSSVTSIVVRKLPPNTSRKENSYKNRQVTRKFGVFRRVRF